MPEFRISLIARRKLIDTYIFTDEALGRYQADAYQSGFERTFGLLAEFPRMGRSADELLPGLRRFRFQSHHIFYTIEDAHVMIVDICHVAQEIRPELFD